MSAWYEKSFGADYLLVYKHRDIQGAYEEVRKMTAWLNLPDGSEVLDLCCGMGRHALALADFGYKVTGMDLSEVLLQEARKADVDERVTWVHGDMRRVPLQRTFDAVVNLFTSFGYFSKNEENFSVLQEIARVLKPGAPFIIDYLNPEYVSRHLVPRSERKESGLIIVEERRIENDSVVKHISIQDDAKGENRTYEERVKLYPLPTMEKMIRDAGLSLLQVFGDYDQTPYDAASSKRMILVGAKEKSE